MTFTADEFKTQSREDFVANECDSDEYRETQPAKLLAFVGEIAFHLEYDARMTELMTLLRAWMNTCPEQGDYAGSEEAKPVCAFVHDILWEMGQHPYYSNVEELIDALSDD